MNDATYPFCRTMWIAAIATILVTLTLPVQAQNLNGAFSEAIDYAQKRMAKVYGATAGRVDGYASGVIVSDNGLIVTMQGVFLDGSNTRVTLSDGTTHPAAVLRRNRMLQLALLKIDFPTPNYFEIGEKEVGKKGDWVVTLSNAFKVADGVEPLSVNLGIISLRTSIEARLSPRDVAYRGPLILIDAITSNPGAGGGAVVKSDGQLVGTIGRVINSSETNTRLNYAVPSDILKSFVAGNLPDEDNNRAVAQSDEPADFGLRLFRIGGTHEPAYIDRVKRSSPAAKFGLKPDDLVISMNGKKIADIRAFDRVMKTLSPGQEIIIIVKRGQRLVRGPITPVAKK